MKPHLLLLLIFSTSVMLMVANNNNNYAAGQDNNLYRTLRMINSMRCMTETSINPSSTYVLYNVRHGILNTDFTVSWHPKTLYMLTNRTNRLTTTTAAARLTFYTTRAYLDNSIPLFYANFNKRNQC